MTSGRCRQARPLRSPPRSHGCRARAVHRRAGGRSEAGCAVQDRRGDLAIHPRAARGRVHSKTYRQDSRPCLCQGVGILGASRLEWLPVLAISLTSCRSGRTHTVVRSVYQAHTGQQPRRSGAFLSHGLLHNTTPFAEEAEQKGCCASLLRAPLRARGKARERLRPREARARCGKSQALHTVAETGTGMGRRRVFCAWVHGAITSSAAWASHACRRVSPSTAVRPRRTNRPPCKVRRRHSA